MLYTCPNKHKLVHDTSDTKHVDTGLNLLIHEQATTHDILVETCCEYVNVKDRHSLLDLRTRNF